MLVQIANKMGNKKMHLRVHEQKGLNTTPLEGTGTYSKSSGDGPHSPKGLVL
jgi:hypothetical protein